MWGLSKEFKKKSLSCKLVFQSSKKVVCKSSKRGQMNFTFGVSWNCPWGCSFKKNRAKKDLNFDQRVFTEASQGCHQPRMGSK